MSPSVSIVTLLTERRRFIDLLSSCIEFQDYDKSKMEWIIVDDSDLPQPEFKKTSLKPFYVSLSKKIPILIATIIFLIFFDTIK